MENNHTITHIEIPAPDLSKAIRFYSELFHWQIQVITEGQYAFFRIGELQSGGGFDTRLLPAPENCGPQIVIDVENITEKLNKIEEHGGIVIMPKTEIDGGHGFYAIFRDPNGNFMQLHSRV